MADWADAQAALLIGDAYTYYSPDVIRQRRAATAEALWQAFENGKREGELKTLRSLVATITIPRTQEESDD